MKVPAQDSQPSSEDNSLLEGLKRQNADALMQLFQRYGPLLRSISMQVLHDETQTSEVVQDVLVQIWSKPGAYQMEKGRFSSWLATLARRRAIDHMRQQGAYRRAIDRYEASWNIEKDVYDEMWSVQKNAENEDLRQILQQHLEMLPPEQRQMVELTFFESKTQREIASQTGIPLGTVKTRIELGIRKLSRSLANMRRSLK